MSRPKILYISRPCTLGGMIQAFAEASTRHLICDSTSHGLQNPQAFSFRNWGQIKHEIEQGAYDMVIALSHHGSIWRNQVGLGRNLVRLAGVSLRKSSTLGLRLLLSTLKKKGLPLAIFEDDDTIPIALRNWPLLEACTRYFKINVPLDLYQAYLYQTARTGHAHNLCRLDFPKKTLHKIKPIGLGSLSRYADRTEEYKSIPKTTDIFFAGNTHYAHYRQETLPEFLRLAEHGVKVDYVEGRVSPEEFARRCAQSHLVWSPLGAGWECFRNYEAGYMNSVAVCTYPNIRRYQPLRQDEHIIMYSPEPGELTRTVLHTLKKRKQDLPQMAAAACAHALRYHHPKRLVEYMIQETMEAFQEKSAKS